ncbi:MAG: hypothetical protein JWN34_2147 [Bryobacterales bacterium]|nr:hypothetical protein [Bryobacterales bacterium]
MIEDIYEELRARAAVRSKAQFSRSFLNRSPNYMSRTRGQIAPASLVELARALRSHPDLLREVLKLVVGGSHDQ